MEKSNKIILFDIDHTLFDTNTYRKACFGELGKRLNQDHDTFMQLANDQYRAMRSHGTFKPLEFLTIISSLLKISVDTKELEKIFFTEEFINQGIYPEVLEVLESLSKDPHTHLGILSFGLDSVQRKKIQAVIHLLQDEYVYINEVDKLQNIPHILEKHSDEKIYIIDDLTSVLEEFKKLHPSVVTFLIQRDESKSKESLDFTPDFVIHDLSELRLHIK